MQSALADARREARQQASTRARSLAVFYATGGLLNVASTAIPGWSPAHRWGLLAVAAIAFVTAGCLVSMGARVAGWQCQALVACGSGLIAGCMASAGSGPMTLAYAFFFTWVAVYAASWFTGPQVAAHLAVALALEAAAIVAVGASSVVLPACLTSMGACASAAAVVYRLQVRVRLLAERDPLTNAANRRGLNVMLLQHSQDGRVRRVGAAMSLIALDLDGFKAFNDAHGHAEGDVMLRDCVTAWHALLRRGEICARLGGDEFVLVCHRPPADVDALAAAAQASVPAPLHASAGVATARDGEPVAALFARADAGLYLDKSRVRHPSTIAMTASELTST